MYIYIFSVGYDVDPMLVTSIVSVESSFNANATGGMGEIGLMQIRSEYLTNPKDYYNPVLNLKEGIKRLSKLQRLEPKLGRYWYCAWNLGAVGAIRYHKRKGLHRFSYCKKVEKRKAELKEEFARLSKNNLKDASYVTIRE